MSLTPYNFTDLEGVKSMVAESFKNFSFSLQVLSATKAATCLPCSDE